MKTQNLITKVIFISFTTLLTACEPPTPGSLSGPIPEYTRQRSYADWQARATTFNVWGLPVISKHKKERMPAIGKSIKSRDLDFVMLEEAWLKDGRNDIYNYAGKKYRHDAVFKNAPLDSGLMYLSDTQITRTSFRPFQLFGPVILPDAWAVKGVGVATTEIRDLTVSFFSTHLLAGLPRFEEKRSPFTPEWKGEMFEVVAHMIEQTDSDAFVLGGDFNVHFGDDEYNFWKRFTSLEGTLLEENYGICTWCADNTYAKKWPRQIDYIFVSPRLKIENVWVDFKEQIDVKDKKSSLSDHYGLTADFSVTQGDSQKDPNMVRQNFRDGLTEVKTELSDYFTLKAAEEQEIREQVKTQGLDERLCLSCRIEKTLKMIEKYEHALDLPESSLTIEERTLRVRLDSWFDLFK